MKHHFNDGGRAESGYRGQVNDCAIRAICIAARLPYKSVYVACAAWERAHKWVNKPVHHFLESCGWTWTPCGGIGGAAVHLRRQELPPGRIIVAMRGRGIADNEGNPPPGHLAAVIDGELHDIFDSSFLCSEGLEGYFTAPEAWEAISQILRRRRRKVD